MNDERSIVRFTTLREAAPLFGYRSGDALRKAFENGHLPARCYIRIGTTGRIDVEGLTAHLRAEAERAAGSGLSKSA